MKKIAPTFWVTNVSNMNVTLSDLALNIPAYRTVNLMDTKHYSYNLEQLHKSADSGSLFKKRNKIVVRKLAPEVHKENRKPIDRETAIPSRERSVLEIKDEKYEELQVGDEEFANENADLADMDNQPVFSKKG
jgi:hypothetical protein